MSFISGAGREPELWKGLVAGAAGGLAATVVMTAFQSLWTRLDRRFWSGSPDGRTEDFPAGNPADLDPRAREDGEMAASPTGRAAEKLARGFFGYGLDPGDREVAGTAIHYGFGTAVGAVYGAVAEYSPAIVRGDGVPFGTGLMAVADDVALPALGVSKPPGETPWSTHLYALCSHAVYGTVLETLRRSLRRFF